MTKEKRILSYFICWLVLGLIICFVGIQKTYAATYNADQFTAQLYDNYGPDLSSVTTEMSSGGWQGIIPKMTANTSGAAWGISSPVTLIANHTYSLTAEITGTYAGKLVLSTYNRIGVGTTLSNAKTSYQNNTNVKEIYSKVQDNGITIQFAFTPSVNGSYIIFPFATNSSAELQYFRLLNIVIDDLGSESLTEEQIKNSLNAQTNELNANINNMGEEIKDSIKDTFVECRDSVNIAYDVQYSATGNDWWSIVNVIQTDIKQGETYTISVDINADEDTIAYWNNSDGVFNTSEFNVKKGLNRYSYTFIALKNATSISQTLTKYGNGDGVVISSSKLQIQKGSVATSYEEPNKQICINKIDETNNKLDEAEKTRKGILQTIIDLPKKIVDFIGDLLKDLFIPGEGYFEDWFNTLKIFFEEKLGFLATPFTIIIDFINRYLELNPQDDIIINIPDISVPNFEEHLIVKATTFNWSQLLKSKESLNTLWQLYLSFIDVFLILNFINLCENKYNRIFGGDTTQYEYYTVEDSYNVDVNTGEVKNMRRNERKTTRKKVN